MSSFAIFAVILVAQLFVPSSGDVVYGTCKAYDNRFDLPTLTNGGRHCIKELIRTYCIEWSCPELNCIRPVVPNSGCPYCPGTCSYNGQVFKYRDSFGCVDRVNTCHCAENGSIKSSEIGVNVEYMCFPKAR